MKCRISLLATICLALAPAASSRAQEPEIKSLDLLKRVVDAHAKLGPATLECKTEIALDYQPLRAHLKETVKRNDPDHSFTVSEVMVGRHTERTFHEYVDGEVRVTYSPDDKEYGRSPDAHDVFKECLDAIRGGLLYPEQSKEWGKAKVKPVRFEEAAAHKITVKNLGIRHRDHANPKSVTLIVDPATSLVRQYEVAFDGEVTWTMTVKYKTQKEPFPASTFVFTAPPGAKESAPGKIDLK